ncbi:DUF368 domain-containing protein [Faecalicoccus pleomorphus]|uniref:DUF368 domain-containing protein n=1 Tax=Faecalicoccus pleomorphus TaxID=1323 RepID=A0A3E3E3S7_9FIRM|nr:MULTISPECIES: DUF368 domain-containing protein [Faecalicoccus]MDB7980994.1 DUF368 domain-containing protein [Faecalicoccus pleomorphus]MDB7983262.1 DUF368 domain-containing protein [Faecalicoccus pleomorphus]MDB7989701.1 DUF368 domain-containing protein [Faecalicoccus pleomorphus]MDB7994182.1 DUF368 domain-containing protein [Faecalicoccus pleomorphus]MDY4278169.1 DUF368 domain-containing protein [Faecalicoccus sp.]
MIKMILQGMIVGIANIIPGVSGGTMMVAMGLYDKLIHSITHLKSEFKSSMKLLLPIFFGAALAIVILSRLFEFLLQNYPIPTNFAFCGLIVGSLPFILKKVKGSNPVKSSNWIPLLIFFAIVVGMAVIGEDSGSAQRLQVDLLQFLVLLFVGIIAAATMVIPGVSGSMMLMLLGYYETILSYVNQTVDAITSFDIPAFINCCMVMIPFGVGVVFGIFAIAKLIEWILMRWEISAYYAIIGLITASPVAILLKTDWSQSSIMMIVIGLITFIAGWFVASKLGDE